MQGAARYHRVFIRGLSCVAATSHRVKCAIVRYIVFNFACPRVVNKTSLRSFASLREKKQFLVLSVDTKNPSPVSSLSSLIVSRLRSLGELLHWDNPVCKHQTPCHILLWLDNHSEKEQV